MSENKKEIATVEEALEDIRAGKIIVVIDDPDRENEGDLICAAEFATQENVNFMACYAKGLICMPMSRELCEKLGLEQMAASREKNRDGDENWIRDLKPEEVELIGDILKQYLA